MNEQRIREIFAAKLEAAGEPQYAELARSGGVDTILLPCLGAAAQAVTEERDRCHDIALAIDSGRGNEKEIARAISQPQT